MYILGSGPVYLTNFGSFSNLIRQYFWSSNYSMPPDPGDKARARLAWSPRARPVLTRSRTASAPAFGRASASGMTGGVIEQAATWKGLKGKRHEQPWGKPRGKPGGQGRLRLGRSVPAGGPALGGGAGDPRYGAGLRAGEAAAPGDR